MLLQIHQKITGEIFFTGAPAVHRWCGEILQYRTLGNDDDDEGAEPTQESNGARGPKMDEEKAAKKEMEEFMVARWLKPSL